MPAFFLKPLTPEAIKKEDYTNQAPVSSSGNNNSSHTTLYSLRIEGCRFAYEISDDSIQIISMDPDTNTQNTMTKIVDTIRHSPTLFNPSPILMARKTNDGRTEYIIALKVNLRRHSSEELHDKLNALLNEKFFDPIFKNSYKLRKLGNPPRNRP